MEVTNAYHDDEKENYPKGYGSEINTILYGWLLKHTNNPYPSLNDKKILMQKTGLTKMQLKNWFCNMRRRKLKDTIRRTKKRSKF
ncbi:hypothetical protein LPJ53_005546 [Coemansia erecta]|uniref:Homeobox domain-containing protein n=1 Tax=Coemansia erecta TaxID=147472 RepID=A0A9W7XWF8_9FUNG|nr:hypothetical protein LPJ53_005546 [Coemansia erecta]